MEKLLVENPATSELTSVGERELLVSLDAERLLKTINGSLIFR